MDDEDEDDVDEEDEDDVEGKWGSSKFRHLPQNDGKLTVNSLGDEDDDEDDEEELEGRTKRPAEDDDEDDEVSRRQAHAPAAVQCRCLTSACLPGRRRSQEAEN